MKDKKDKSYFLTITGLNHYYGMKPIEIGRILKLIKDQGNEFDEEAIVAVLPYVGTIGYVANSHNTVAKGTYSAGRIYDFFEEEAFAEILFATKHSVICLLILPEEMEDKEENEIKEETIEQEYEKGNQVESRARYQQAKVKIGFGE